MNKFIRIFKFAQQLFTDEKAARQASQIIEGIMAARSPRLSDIAAHMPGGRSAEGARSARGWGSSVPRPDGRWGGQVEDWSNPVLPQRPSVVYCTVTGEGGSPLHGGTNHFT